MVDRDDSSLMLTGDLGCWEVKLLSGETVTIFAHGYSEEGESAVFSILLEGEPCVEQDIARIPRQLIETIEGG